VEMFTVNFVTFAFCKLFFCHDSLENVAGIDAFTVVSVPAARQKIFNMIFEVSHSSCYRLISEHIGEKLPDSAANGCEMTVH